MNLLLKKHQIYDQLRRKILDGEYQALEQLPSTVTLSETMGVSMKTMRAALAALAKDGLIQRIHGRGTFVSADIVSTNTKYLLLDATMDFESSNNEIIPLLEKYASKENIELEKCAYEFFKQQSLEDSLVYIKNEGFSGIIDTAANYIGNEPILELFKKCNLPVVQSHAGPSDRLNTGSAAIHPIDYEAFTDGIRYLAKKGHRRIAVLGGNSSDQIRHVSKSEFMELLTELDCETVDEFYGLCSYDENIVRNYIKRLISLPKSPTAILCFSDFYAIYVYKALKEVGVKIPDDIAVLGYCNYPGGQAMHPPLSTIDLGHEDAVKCVFNLLQQANKWFAQDNVAIPEIIIKHKIIERGSSNIKRIEHELVSPTKG